MAGTPWQRKLFLQFSQSMSESKLSKKRLSDACIWDCSDHGKWTNPLWTVKREVRNPTRVKTWMPEWKWTVLYACMTQRLNKELCKYLRDPDCTLMQLTILDRHALAKSEVLNISIGYRLYRQDALTNRLVQDWLQQSDQQTRSQCHNMNRKLTCWRRNDALVALWKECCVFLCQEFLPFRVSLQTNDSFNTDTTYINITCWYSKSFLNCVGAAFWSDIYGTLDNFCRDETTAIFGQMWQ